MLINSNRILLRIKSVSVCVENYLIFFCYLLKQKYLFPNCNNWNTINENSA